MTSKQQKRGLYDLSFVIRLGLVIVSVKRFHQAKATERTLGREPPSNKREVFTTSLL